MSQRSGSTLCPDGCPDPRDAEIARLTAALATERASHAAAMVDLRGSLRIVINRARRLADEAENLHDESFDSPVDRNKLEELATGIRTIACVQWRHDSARAVVEAARGGEQP